MKKEKTYNPYITDNTNKQKLRKKNVLIEKLKKTNRIGNRPGTRSGSTNLSKTTKPVIKNDYKNKYEYDPIEYEYEPGVTNSVSITTDDDNNDTDYINNIKFTSFFINPN